MIASPFKSFKSLPDYRTKAEGESYFADCERDEGGQCLPSGEAGEKKPEETPKQKDDADGEKKTKVASLNPRLLNKLIPNYDKISDAGLRQRVKNSVRAYTDGDFTEMNNSLRENRDSNLASTIDDFKAAFAEVGHTLEKDVLVYRKVGKLPFSVDKVGTVFQDRGFVSTTAKEDYARGTSANFKIFKIRVPKGQRVLVPYGTNELSHEVVLEAGTKFRVVKVGKQKLLGQEIMLEVVP